VAGRSDLLGPDSSGHMVEVVRRRSTPDAALLAVVRDGELVPNPPPAFRLCPGHVVIVVGPMAAALDMLEVIGRP
jgi:K+/H+ antiporter YhaU regulatory subunit KhtT